MKKIINGLRYDTDSATNLGAASSNYFPSDFHWWEAALYRTPRSGRHFIAGSGGALSEFGRPAAGGGRCGGERVIPMDDDEAREWAEQNLTTEEIETAFASAIADA